MRAAKLGERHPLALIVLGVLLFSTGPVLVQSSDLTGPVLSFWRLWIGVAGTGLLTVVHIRVSGRRPTPEGWAWAARSGVAFGFHQLMFMVAIKATSVVDVTLMQVLAPIVVAVMAVPMFDERPGARFRLWSVVAVAGAAVVAAAGSTGPEGEPLGMALAAGNVLLYALFFVWSKRARGQIDVVPFLFGVMTVAAVTVTAFVLVTGESPGSADSGDLLVAAVIALVPGGLGHFVSTWPLRWVPANIPPLLQLAIPFLSGALAWLLLDEGITLLHVAGGALTIIGVAGAVGSAGGRRLVVASASSPPSSLGSTQDLATGPASRSRT
jgi:drug/metabolite transporter (DMT)-like permease